MSWLSQDSWSIKYHHTKLYTIFRSKQWKTWPWFWQLFIHKCICGGCLLTVSFLYLQIFLPCRCCILISAHSVSGSSSYLVFLPYIRPMISFKNLNFLQLFFFVYFIYNFLQLFFFVYFILFFATLTACVSSGARDRTHIIAVTWATKATTSDP